MTRIPLYLGKNDVRNANSGGEWKVGDTCDLEVNEAFHIHIYNIFISIKM